MATQIMIAKKGLMTQDRENLDLCLKALSQRGSTQSIFLRIVALAALYAEYYTRRLKYAVSIPLQP